jgi:aspartate carbamoyltransferase catalytic subunit
MGKVKRLKNKHLLGLKDLSVEDINLILNTASSMKEVFTRQVKRVPTLLAKNIVTLFYEPSTRTRTSFHTAAKMLSANTTNIALSTSSVKKGETLLDTVRNIEVMGVDSIIIRHPLAGVPHFIAEHTNTSIINAGDGSNEHPTQGLLDIFSMIEKKGKIEGKNILIIGDISHSRVARSNIWGATKLGAKITVIGPPTFIPKDAEEMGVKVSYDLDKEIGKADIINVLRIQKERQAKGIIPSTGEYTELFGITKERLKKAKKDILIMHPGPINRGIEMTSDVADGPNSVILEQVKNGVAIRMAILFLLLGGNS